MDAEKQPCPWCSMKETVDVVSLRLELDVVASQWGVARDAMPEDLWTAHVQCGECGARGPRGTAISSDAAAGVARGRWSEMIEWARRQILPVDA